MLASPAGEAEDTASREECPHCRAAVPGDAAARAECDRPLRPGARCEPDVTVPRPSMPLFFAVVWAMALAHGAVVLWVVRGLIH